MSDRRTSCPNIAVRPRIFYGNFGPVPPCEINVNQIVTSIFWLDSDDFRLPFQLKRLWRRWFIDIQLVRPKCSWFVDHSNHSTIAIETGSWSGFWGSYLGVVPETGFSNAFRITIIVIQENISQKNIKRHHIFLTQTHTGIIQRPSKVTIWNSFKVRHFLVKVSETQIKWTNYLPKMIYSGVFSIQQVQSELELVWLIKWLSFPRASHRDLCAVRASADAPTYRIRYCYYLHISSLLETIWDDSSKIYRLIIFSTSYLIFSSAVSSSKLCN